MNYERKLIPLKEFNKEHEKSYSKTFPNGIACPECGNEMYDNYDAPMLMSSPPKISIYCVSCGHQNWRIA